MKYGMPAIAVASCLVCGSAFAQSSNVRLYGLIDNGFVYNNNAKGASQYQLASGNLQGSRWGIAGTEDLGGGLSAVFRLEGGYSIDSGALGQGGSLFGRRATIGLANRYGTFSLGRQYDALTDYMAGYSATGSARGDVVKSWAGVYGAHPGDLDNLGGSNRTNNVIKFSSASFNGLSGEVAYSLGNKAGDITSSQSFSFAGAYRNGPLDAGVAYQNVRNPNYANWGVNPSANTATSTSSLNMNSPIYSGFASAKTMQVVAAGAAYQIGTVRIGGIYTNVEFQHLGGTPGNGLNPLKLAGTAVFNTYELNVAWRPIPVVQLALSYALTQGSSVGSVSGANYGQWNLGADYSLSKRTDLYAVMVYQRASGVDSTGKAAVAAVANLSASSTSSQVGATVGIRHVF
ncbi:porin [Pandoraea sp. NPDC087047]|uniref:porin n=1 Tax=Pandoraea sp. NPDC087047 TaxID=3364390 RepID=UPI003822DA50